MFESQTAGVHPMLQVNGYQIVTKPIEVLMNLVLCAIEDGHHGLRAYGGGRIGKTTALRLLKTRSGEWLKGAGSTGSVRIPREIRRSKGTFIRSLSDEMQLRGPTSTSATREARRLAMHILDRCGKDGTKLFVLFVDNAERLHQDEFEYLLEIDDLVEERQVRLFLLLMRQSDACGASEDADFSRQPTHITGRYLLVSHEFTPLIGLPDLQHALAQLDSEACWPNREMPFTRFFAPGAFDDGYRLAKIAPKIARVLQDVRDQYSLPFSEALTMKSFSGIVRHLLTIIAYQNPAFSEFSVDDIRSAVLRSGYVELEQARTGLVIARAQD